MLVDQPSITDVSADSCEHHDAAHLDRVRLLRNCGLKPREIIAELPDVSPHTVRRLLSRIEKVCPTVDDQCPKLVATDVGALPPTSPRDKNNTSHGLAERERRAALKARTDALLAPIRAELRRRKKMREAQLERIELSAGESWGAIHAECKRSAESLEERRARALHRGQLAREIEQLQGHEPGDHE